MQLGTGIGQRWHLPDMYQLLFVIISSSIANVTLGSLSLKLVAQPQHMHGRPSAHNAAKSVPSSLITHGIARTGSEFVSLSLRRTPRIRRRDWHCSSSRRSDYRSDNTWAQQCSHTVARFHHAVHLHLEFCGWKSGDRKPHSLGRMTFGVGPTWVHFCRHEGTLLQIRHCLLVVAVAHRLGLGCPCC